MPHSLQENKGIREPSLKSVGETCSQKVFKAPTARAAVSSAAVCGEADFQIQAITAFAMPEGPDPG